MFPRTLELAGSVKSLAQGVIKTLTLRGKNMTFLAELLLLSCQNILTLTIFDGESNKTSVLLCKRLPGQCRDVYMVVYFHLH